MKSFIKKFFILMSGVFLALGVVLPSVHVAAQEANFGVALEKGVESVRQHLDAPDISGTIDTKAEFVVKKVIDILFPIIIIIGVLVAMFGLYSILTSSDTGKMKEGINMMIYGVIAIIIMYSAKYLSLTLFTDVFKGGVGEAMTTVEWIRALYDKIGFPFIKLTVYLSLGFLVIMMMIRVFSYITAQDDGTKKKALGVISWTTIGMLFIIAAKQIVEAVYGKQEKVLAEGVQNLSGIGTQILNPKEIPIFFTLMNWALGLIAFVLLVMILMQTYKMLTKPDDAETFKSLKKTIGYALGGLILIGSAYLLSNLFILN